MISACTQFTDRECKEDNCCLYKKVEYVVGTSELSPTGEVKGWRISQNPIQIIRKEYNMEWISVKDRLPNNNQWVLAFNGNDMCVCWTDISHHDYLFMFGLSHRSQFQNVTHWMPLPELPNE
jgi:hypothetical protein